MAPLDLNLDLPDFPGAPRVDEFSFLEPCLLLRVAGRGGMGLVYEAFDVLRSRKVAVKVSSNPAYSPRFYLEAVLGISDLGEHVVQVLDIRRFRSTDYILMEWVEGADLQSITSENVLNSGQLAEVAAQVCAGLTQVHAQGIIHRDIKPANLMVTHDGVVKLADLGIAQSPEALHLATVGPIGTRLFMSPEQRAGRKTDARSDIYSVGVTLYMLATGLLHRERSGEVERMLSEGLAPIAELAPDLDPALAAIITKCSEEEPADRYPTTEALAKALRGLALETEPVLPVLTRVPTPNPSDELIRKAREFRLRGTPDPGPPGEPSFASVAEAYGPISKTTLTSPKPRERRNLLALIVGIPLLCVLAALAIDEPELPQDQTSQAEPGDGEAALASALKPSETEFHTADKASELPATALAEEGDAAKILDEARDASPPAETPESQQIASTAVIGDTNTAPPITEPVPLDPPASSTPSLEGFDTHTDSAGRVAFVPQLKLELDARLQRKLRFVAFDSSEAAGLLVQEMEVARELAFALDLIPDPKDERCLPLTRVNLELAQLVAERLNEQRIEGAPFRFVVPTTTQRQRIEELAGICELAMLTSSSTREKLRPGYGPSTEGRGARPKFRSVYGKDLWHPIGSAGLFAFVGNVSELCQPPAADGVDFRGGSEWDRAKRDIKASNTVPATTKYRLSDGGLRLFIELTQ